MIEAGQRINVELKLRGGAIINASGYIESLGYDIDGDTVNGNIRVSCDEHSMIHEPRPMIERERYSPFKEREKRPERSPFDEMAVPPDSYWSHEKMKMMPKEYKFPKILNWSILEKRP